MKKFTILTLEDKSIESELEMGIRIESEHGDLYDFFENYLLSNGIDMPMTKMEFYSRIAKAHLKELPDYYTRLHEMETSDSKFI